MFDKAPPRYTESESQFMSVGEGIVSLRVPMEDYELPALGKDHEETL